MIKFKNHIKLNFLLVLSMTVLLVLQSCSDDPNDLGINYLPTVDTTGVKYLDSETDTMAITSNNYKEYINTYLATLLSVGNYQNYESKALLKFYNIDRNLDSATVISATLKLTYGNYAFKDKTGLTEFNIHKVVRDLNYTTITNDSVSASDFSVSSIGGYSGVIADSTSISMAIDNNTVKDWLEYAADTGYAVKNYGIGLIPSAASSTIKGFYLINDDGTKVPTLTVIYSKNSVQDTIEFNASIGLFLANAPLTVVPNDRILLQNGIAFRDIMNFDLTKLPRNVIINNATLLFTLDSKNSFISETTEKRIIIGMVTDSINKKDSLYNNAFLLDTITYSANLNSVFQRWNSGEMSNLGITLKNYYERVNIDNFAIFPPGYSDSTKRPRLKITYTLRN